MGGLFAEPPSLFTSLHSLRYQIPLPLLSHDLKPVFFSPVLRELPLYEVVHPARVDARGHFLSNFLSHHARRVTRREAVEGSADLDRVFYQLRHGDRGLRLNLTLNPHLLAPAFVTERRYGGLRGARIQPLPRSSQCHFLGEVWDEATVKGSAAISTCDGLVSYKRTEPDMPSGMFSCVPLITLQVGIWCQE